MKTITAILVDDEEKSRDVLRNLLKNFFAEIELLGEAEDVEKANVLINKVNPQLVFLDIQMPRASGFNLLKDFEEVPFEVIFVTSYDKYAMTAIKFSALDYLMKPVEVADLREAVSKAVKRIEQKNNSSQLIVNLVRNMSGDEKNRQIAVHSGEKVRLLNENTIAIIEADGNYCHITTDANEKFTTAKYLKDFEDYFDNGVFVKIHKGCIINVKHIKEYSKGEPCIIEMVNGSTVEVARRKKQEILERLRG